MTDHVTVLVVDDQAPFREVARLVVEMSEGFDLVGEAANGISGVAAAAELHPTLVLMDLNMPDIDGFEATRRILQSSPETRVLVLSTHDPADYREQALAAGAFDFISKSSFDPEVLAHAWTRATAGA
jgi:DNA-binding NarL/FixJ family response regulator